VITWGDIVGTPLHIEAEDAKAGAATPAFRIRTTSRRDQLHWKLAEDAARRKKKTPTPSPLRQTPLFPVRPSPGTPARSPAAAGLLSRTGGTKGSDAQLRASYSATTPVSSRPVPSPAHTPSSSAAGAGTRGKRGAGSSLARQTPTPVRTPQQATSLTDGLL
jgi:hypothetical protein